MSFNFTVVNPKYSGLQLSAEKIGGVCVGTIAIKPTQIESYERFHGTNSVGQSETLPEVVIVELPFSAFASRDNGDPAVSDLIKMSMISKRQNAVLFRVPWRLSQKIGVKSAEYIQAVSNVFKEKDWHVETRLSDGFNDLFIAVVKRKKWNRAAILPKILPSSQINSLIKEELFELKGYPAQILPIYISDDVSLIKEAVSVYVAEDALKYITNAIGLDQQ